MLSPASKDPAAIYGERATTLKRKPTRFLVGAAANRRTILGAKPSKVA